MAPCTIHIEEHPDVAIIKLSGTLAHLDVQPVLSACKQVLAKGYRKVIIDVIDLRHVDLDGLSAIISSYTHCANAEARFVLWNSQKDVVDLLTTTKLVTIIPMASGELTEALAKVNLAE